MSIRASIQLNSREHTRETPVVHVSGLVLGEQQLLDATTKAFRLYEYLDIADTEEPTP